MWQKITQHRLALLVIGTLFYDVLPADLIPDVVPMFGLVDDLGITGMAAILFVTWWRQRKLASAEAETAEADATA